jgi:hypothetical protein
MSENIVEQGSLCGAPDYASANPPLPKVASKFNRLAMKRQAMKYSKECRAGKFERVSQEFLSNVEAAIEAKIKTFEYTLQSELVQCEPAEGEKFLTGAGEKRLIQAFNVWIAREIQRQGKNVRIGKTL